MAEITDEQRKALRHAIHRIEESIEEMGHAISAYRFDGLTPSVLLNFINAEAIMIQNHVEQAKEATRD